MDDLINGEGRPCQAALQSATQEVVNTASVVAPRGESNTVAPDSRGPSLYAQDDAPAGRPS
jgi:hypothetical protein